MIKNERTLVRYRFLILIATVAISGFSQGMLLPLIAIIFEREGISSSINGLHATGIYIGILIASPFMEGVLSKLGYKRIIGIGVLLVVLSLALFPLWKSIWFWFILRLLIGIGNSLLHFGSQTWLTSFSPKEKRGRNISLYGLSFGLGFGVGPIMTRLLEINENLPFLISSGLGLVVWFSLLFLKNEYPEQDIQRSSIISAFDRYRNVWKHAWIAFLLPFGYGFLEASLNGNFPVFALRIGIDISSVSIILPAFAIGSIVFQLPLGMLSDRYGRRNILLIVMIAGFSTFTAAGFIVDSVLGLLICFFIAGMLVGSIYSLGISYMVDLLPKKSLPIGNIICSILFSLGSISGPFIGGLAIQYLEGSFFYTISLMLLAQFVALALFRKRDEKEVQKEGYLNH